MPHSPTSEDPMTYTVRAPGCTAWSGPGLTARAAVADYREAIQRGLHDVRIWTDEDDACDATDALLARLADE